MTEEAWYTVQPELGGRLTCDCSTRSLATTHHLRLARLTCDCRDRKLTCDCRDRGNVMAWGGGGGGGVGGGGGDLNASAGHCGEGCRVGGGNMNIVTGQEGYNASGQRGLKQERRKQWRQRDTHFESRVTCWRCAMSCLTRW